MISIRIEHKTNNSILNLFQIIAQRAMLSVSRSMSTQLIDSFAQTELIDHVIPEESIGSDSVDAAIEKDMIDSGVDQVQRSDRLSITEPDDGTSSYSERLRLASISDEDAAVIVDNPLSSQEVFMT